MSAAAKVSKLHRYCFLVYFVGIGFISVSDTTAHLADMLPVRSWFSGISFNPAFLSGLCILLGLSADPPGSFAGGPALEARAGPDPKAAAAAVALETWAAPRLKEIVIGHTKYFFVNS